MNLCTYNTTVWYTKVGYLNKQFFKYYYSHYNFIYKPHTWSYILEDIDDIFYEAIII